MSWCFCLFLIKIKMLPIDLWLALFVAYDYHNDLLQFNWAFRMHSLYTLSETKSHWFYGIIFDCLRNFIIFDAVKCSLKVLIIFPILLRNIFTRRKIATMDSSLYWLAEKHSFSLAKLECYTYVDLLTWRRRQWWNRKQTIRYLAIINLFLRKYFPREEQKKEQRIFEEKHFGGLPDICSVVLSF